MADTKWVMGFAPLVLAMDDGGRFTRDIPVIDSLITEVQCKNKKGEPCNNNRNKNWTP